MAPFDFIGDSLRGTQGVILDMYRQPDKLLAAIDLITPIVIKHGIDTCNTTGGVMVHFPLHKGDDTFMSDKQFEKFYWPSLKKYCRCPDRRRHYAESCSLKANIPDV